MNRFSNLRFGTAVLLALLTSHAATGADWPMWRFDGRRSASTPEQLPAELHLQWSIQQPAPRLAWPEDARLRLASAAGHCQSCQLL